MGHFKNSYSSLCSSLSTFQSRSWSSYLYVYVYNFYIDNWIDFTGGHTASMRSEFHKSPHPLNIYFMPVRISNGHIAKHTK
jgi:hypothetical protein